MGYVLDNLCGLCANRIYLQDRAEFDSEIVINQQPSRDALPIRQVVLGSIGM